jgi:pentatricopeptide repeat protein
MNSNKSTTEILDEFYRGLTSEEIEEKTSSKVIIDEKTCQPAQPSQLETHLKEFEQMLTINESENSLDKAEKEVSPSEEKISETLTLTVNERQESSVIKFLPNKDTKKAKLKVIYSILKGREEISNHLWTKTIELCLKNQRVIELLQILVDKNKEDLIMQLFSLINPTELHDYEDCLFILAEFITKNGAGLDSLFKLLQFSASKGVYQLYPVFSLALRKLTKVMRLNDATMVLNYIMHHRVEISNCVINFFIETFCKLEKIEEAQGFFTKFLSYKPMCVFPSDILEKCHLNKLVLSEGVNIITYGTIIKGLCKSNHMELALYYYERLKEKNMIKDEVIFNLLFDGCSKTSNLDQLRNIYFDMLTMDIRPTIVTFNTIIDAYIRARDINSAWKIYDDIFKKGIEPDNFTYSTLFRGIRLKQHSTFLMRSFKILEDLKEKETLIDIILVNVLLDSCVALREDRLLAELFDKAIKGYFMGVKADTITFNTFVKGCAQMSMFPEAFQAYELMFQGDVCVTPNDVFFNTMIDVCVRSNNMPKVWGVIEKMKDFGIKPDNFTYSTIIKGLNKNTSLKIEGDGNSTKESFWQSDKENMHNIHSKHFSNNSESLSELDIAFRLFENVKKCSKPDEILYNCIMDACLRFHNIDKMLELYEEMITDNIKPSSITCGIVIKAYGMQGNLGRALELYEEMKREGIEISSITYGCLINACIKNDDLSKAFELYEELDANKIEMNTVLYTTLIKAYSKRRDVNKVLDIFNHMKRDKHNSPNNVTYNSVIDCLVKCEKLSLAEKILEEMHKSGVKADIITFSTLIKGSLKKGDLDKALKYVETMCKQEIRPDEVLLNSLLDGCEKMQEYTRAVEIFSKVRGMDVEPSMMSFSIMMKILGKLGDFEGSMNLMQEIRKKNKNVSLIVFTCFMKTCFTTGHPEEGLSAYKELKTFKLNPDSITFATVLNGLLMSKDKFSKEKSNLIDREILNILTESLKSNILLKEKIYFDIMRKFTSSSDKSLHNEIKLLFDTFDIKVKFNKNGNQTAQKKEGGFDYLINTYKHKPYNKKDKISSAAVFTPCNENRVKPLYPLADREVNSTYNNSYNRNLNTTSNTVMNSNNYFSKAQTQSDQKFHYFARQEGYSNLKTNEKTPYSYLVDNTSTSTAAMTTKRSDKENPRMRFHAVNRNHFGQIAQVLTPLFNQFGSEMENTPSIISPYGDSTPSIKHESQPVKRKFNRF